jgi:5'-nucleotidase
VTTLITNDDGLHAAGIRALAETLAEFLPVVVVAPWQERSGASHALTMHDAIRMWPTADGRYAVEGTPVDCVYVGVHQILDEPPSMVVSGINRGANLGDDVFYSGTVGGAREGALMGIPSLAVSLHMDGTRGPGSPNYQSACHFAARVVRWMQSRTLGPDTLLNLNVPDRPLADIEGLKICPLGRRHYEPLIDARKDPRGRPYYWVGGEPVEDQMAEGSDGWWIARGWATLSPLTLDHTSHPMLEELSGPDGESLVQADS